MFDITLQVLVDADMNMRIDDYRASLRPVPPKGAAIRKLIEYGLELVAAARAKRSPSGSAQAGADPGRNGSRPRPAAPVARSGGRAAPQTAQQAPPPLPAAEAWADPDPAKPPARRRVPRPVAPAAQSSAAPSVGSPVPQGPVQQPGPGISQTSPEN